MQSEEKYHKVLTIKPVRPQGKLFSLFNALKINVDILIAKKKRIPKSTIYKKQSVA